MMLYAEKQSCGAAHAKTIRELEAQNMHFVISLGPKCVLGWVSEPKMPSSLPLFYRQNVRLRRRNRVT